MKEFEGIGRLPIPHYDFGDPAIGFKPKVVGLRRATVDLDETTDVVRVGVNLRFSGWWSYLPEGMLKDQ